MQHHDSPFTMVDIVKDHVPGAIGRVAELHGTNITRTGGFSVKARTKSPGESYY